MSLDRYRHKRDFTRTPEPSGAASGPEVTADGHRFVVQRHRARRRHYDLRLEMDGVLVSWAVPKGPTLDPAARRLAVHVEDHPLEYIDFEGVIPTGEYGGGDVIVWDRGRWAPVRAEDPVRAVADGELHFDLFGEKLRGRFVLVRGGMGDAARDEWLLLHKRDDDAVPGWDPEDHPQSVLSGRTNDEVAADPDRRWTSAGEEVLRFAGPTPDEVGALAAMGAKGTWHVGGHDVALTNLDKVLFPPRAKEKPVTKRELVQHYACVAPVMLPHLTGRPLNLQRFPEGAGTKGFWQKQLPTWAPDWITRWNNPEADKGESETYVVADSLATLAWLANHAAIELHAWTSTCASPREPSYALIDIDPGEDTAWDDVLLLARLHRDGLAHLGVAAYPKVSGQRGIQIWVPVRAGLSFDDTRGWVEQLSRAIGHVVPELVSWAWGKRDRRGLARLDYTQNAINKTLVAPYSVRPAAGAPVSVPVTWDELDDPELRPGRWTVRTIGARLAEVGDLWHDIRAAAQPLPPLA